MRRQQKIHNRSVILNPAASTLRPIMFLFYTLETFFNMGCMAFHIKGFTGVDFNLMSWDKLACHYFYLVTFYIFMVLTLFQSINICTGHTPTVGMEIFKTCLASFAFIMIAIMTMWDAERGFHLTYKGEEPVEGVYECDQPVHPFSYYLLFQSVASLTCGVLYMLHATIMIDVWFTKHFEEQDRQEYVMPLRLYVFGKYVQEKLEQYDWFQEFCLNSRIDL